MYLVAARRLREPGSASRTRAATEEETRLLRDHQEKVSQGNYRNLLKTVLIAFLLPLNFLEFLH